MGNNISQVIFKFDKEKDLFNIWQTCNVDSKWYDFKKTIHSSFLEICKGKEFKECKKELEKYRKKMHESGFIEIFVECLQKVWDSINDEYFKRLEKIMKRPLNKKEHIAYVTTIIRCPYDYNVPWFMVSFFRDIPNAIKTCGHEIMHIQFHNTYWKEIEKEIGNEKTAHLKEALTILLNLEFKDLWFVDDYGYEMHKELRKFIEEKWKEEKDFDSLIKKCISYLKKNNV